MYEVVALLPAASDFTLERAIRHYASRSFSQYRCGRFIYQNEPVRAELATSPGEQERSGFRVFYGEWSVVAWLDARQCVLADS
jgi:hypothetical protein